MRSRSEYCLALFLVVGALCVCSRSDTIDITSAEEFLRDYTAAVERGDSARVAAFWSERSRRRVGFWTMHFTVGSMISFPDMTRHLKSGLTFEIDDVTHADDYAVVSISWVTKEQPHRGEAPGHLRLYITQEQGRSVLINPIDALTHDWTTHETLHFLYHAPSTVRLDDHAADLALLDRETDEICNALGIDHGDKLDYYFVRSPEECGELMLQRPSNGYAALARRAIVSVECANTHEAVHMVSYIAGLFPGDGALAEGLAVAFGGNTRTTPAFSVQYSSTFLDNGRYIPLAILFTMSPKKFFQHNYLTYFEAGAFVRFLFARHGAGPLVEFLRAVEPDGSFDSTFSRIYGRSLVDIEPEFKNYLRQHAVPAIATTVAEDAERVFAMDDPAGDDTGDGDYEYPNNRFSRGVFDLRSFEVLSDGESTGFRITLSGSVVPVSYLPGGERFVPGVVIAINRHGDGGGGSLRTHCHGIEFPDDTGFDMELVVGFNVAVVNAHGRIHWSSPTEVTWQHGGETSTFEFTLPVDVLGRPTARWEYFVGTGLMSDRTMIFLHAGPAPVQREARIFIGGGNHDYGNPAFIDILLPPNIDQTQILGNYHGPTQKRATVPLVGAGSQQMDGGR